MATIIERHEFDSLAEYAAYAEQVPEKNYSRTHKKNQWAGGTFAEALHQAKFGNADFTAPFAEELTMLEKMYLSEHEQDVRDVSGEYFDVGDFLSGEPECFYCPVQEKQKPTVTITANVSMNWRQSATLIRRRGCAILALADQLMTRGFHVSLKLLSCLDFEQKNYVFSIRVRQSPLELNDAVFILANPLYFRRLGFAALEYAVQRSSCDNYGFPCDVAMSDLFSEDECGFYFCSSNHEKYHAENYIGSSRICRHLDNMIEQFNEGTRIVVG